MSDINFDDLTIDDLIDVSDTLLKERQNAFKQINKKVTELVRIMRDGSKLTPFGGSEYEIVFKAPDYYSVRRRQDTSGQLLYDETSKTAALNDVAWITVLENEARNKIVSRVKKGLSVNGIITQEMLDEFMEWVEE